MEFKETLEQFKKLFQGTDSYYGKSKPLGQKNSRGKEEYKHWTEKTNNTDKQSLDQLSTKFRPSLDNVYIKFRQSLYQV